MLRTCALLAALVLATPAAALHLCVPKTQIRTYW